MIHKKIIFFTKTIILFSLLIPLAGCKNNNEGKKLYNAPNKATLKTEPQNFALNQNHVINVYVHGTLLPIPSLTAFGKTFMEDKKNRKNQPKEKKERSFYQKYLDNLRTSGIFACQPINDWGLIEIDAKSLDPQEQSKPRYQIANIHKNIDLNLLQNNNTSYSFYTFGWDGRLSKDNRLMWSQRLYLELFNEIEKIKNKFKPKNLTINIFAHSHGGNVVLNLAAAEKKYNKNLSIDRIILLGTPVQSETKCYVNSPIFKNIYSFYSTGDNMQIIDILSTKDNISQRRFDESKKENFVPPKKLYQVEIIAGKYKPTHSELWGFGLKDNFIYRKKFPINPLPILALSPIAINYIESNPEKHNNFLLHMEKNGEKLDLHFHKANPNTQKAKSYYRPAKPHTSISIFLNSLLY
jgi:hypothetical protein